MSILRPETVRAIFIKRPEYRKIKTFIETGTNLAKTIRNMQGLFEELHTIELSKKLYQDVVANYGNLDINFHFGDSINLLPEIAQSVNGPIFFYLDAHGFNRKHVAAGFPLWQELDFIRNRKHADIIMVDDVHAFGQKGSLRNEPGWVDVNSPAILNHLGPKRTVEKMIKQDGLVIYRRASGK